MVDMIELENELWQVKLVPAAGGSVSHGRVRIGDAWVDVLRPTPDADLKDPWANASFPLVPWSNRIVAGDLVAEGKHHQLRVNFADGTAIHGTALEFPWTVVEATPTSATLEFRSADFAGVNWPWRFITRFGYELDGERFTWHMSLTNDDDEAFPAGLGHHPYFLRQLAVGEEALLQLNCELAYPNVGCIPTHPAAEVAGKLDFRSLRPLGTEFVDDCWLGRTSSTLATVEYPGALTLDVEAGALCEHAVVYIPQGQPFFALEPVTNANDAFNFAAKGWQGHGLFTLQPGESRSTSFTLVAQPQA